MKILRHSCFKAMIIMSLFIGVSAENALGEVTYLGEFCFYLYDGSLRPPDIDSRVGVLAYGTDHFLLSGITNYGYVNGTAALEGKKVIMSLSGMAAGPTDFPYLAGFFLYITVDSDTGMGNYRVRGWFWSYETPDIAQPLTVGGTVSIRTCPQ